MSAGMPVKAPPEEEGLRALELPVDRLLQALRGDELVLYAQPIVSLARPPLAAMAEVLVRMLEEEKKLLPPGTFLPLFEQAGLMPELDRWVVSHAIERLSRSARRRRLFLNISAQTVSDPDFLVRAAHEARVCGLKGGLLAFELGEAALLGRPSSVEDFAAAARRLGFCLALDGYGEATGWPHVEALRPEFVKLDRRIVLASVRDPAARERLAVLARAAHTIGAVAIAEFVESEAARECMRGAGLDFAQGYGVALPHPIESILGP